MRRCTCVCEYRGKYGLEPPVGPPTKNISSKLCHYVNEDMHMAAGENKGHQQISLKLHG